LYWANSRYLCWLKPLLKNRTHHWDVRFSLALALPLFAMFPGWLNSLPRRMVKYGKSRFRISRIGFSFKFLSNADLVLQCICWKEKCFWLFGLQFWNTSFLLIW
jgi:thiol:disulfide interchange protein DsbD